MQLFLKEQDKCKSKKGPRVRFLLQGEAIRLVYELSVKTLMCFWWLNYEIYATICPLEFWLVSFLICVNYLVGILISCLMFLCLKCLLTVGETQYCVYSVGLWFICYTSQSFECSWFSVCFSLMNVFPLVFKLFNQNPIKTLFYFIVFIEIALACSFVVWEQFLAQTYLVPLSGMKLKAYFPWAIHHSTSFERWTKPTNH